MTVNPETYLQVALIRMPPDTAKAELVGTSRDPCLAAVVHRALRDELDDAFRKIDSAGPEVAERASQA